jgi:hypothetical protein
LLRLSHTARRPGLHVFKIPSLSGVDVQHIWNF